MQFIANYDVKNVFGCFENVEQHALAFSGETAAKLFDSGMKIFRGDASTLNALKICFPSRLECPDRSSLHGIFRYRREWPGCRGQLSTRTAATLKSE